MSGAEIRPGTTAEVPGAQLSDLLAPRFPVLDTLRAVGALCVLTTHVTFYSGDYTGHGILGAVLARLDIGVALFFVLSGFLLTRPYLARAALGLPHPSTGVYYAKRVVRIYPVYAVAVVLGLVLLRDNHDLGTRDWLVTLSLTNTFIDPLPPAGLSQMWSLGVEVSFYLVLPLLMLAAIGRGTLRPRRVLALLLVAVAITVWWHLDGAARADGLTQGPPLQWLPAYLTWFSVGIALALAHVMSQTGRSSRLVSRVLAVGRQPGSCWVVAVALLLVAATPLGGPSSLTVTTPAESLTKNLLYAVAAGLVVLSGIVADSEGTYGATLSHRTLRRLGLISYSIFCLHLMLIDLIAQGLGFPLFGGHGLTLWALTVLASVALAEVTYRVVEVPGLRLKRVFTRGAAARTSATRGTTER